MDVSDAFPPGLASFGRSLRPPNPAARPVPAVLARFREARGAASRADLSMWSQRYLLALVPPVLAASLRTDRAPSLGLDGAAVLPANDGMPEAVCLPGLDRSGPADLPGSLLREHLVPLAAVLAEAGLPAPVFWSNAGYVLSWTLRTVTCPDAPPLLLRLQSPFWSGHANPLPPAVRAALAGGGRSVCCLRFQRPGSACCPECPKRRPSTGIGTRLKPAANTEDGEDGSSPRPAQRQSPRGPA